MNVVKKRLSVVGFTVLLILFASASLYGNVTLTAGERLVFYVDSNSHLHALFAPKGGGWTDVDLKVTDSFIPLAAAGGALTSVVDNFDQVHVYYLTTNNQICDLLITGISSSGFTGEESIPTSIPGAPAPIAGSALTAVVDVLSGTQDFIHVFYQGTNGQVYHFYYDGGGGSTVYFDDPTSLAGGPVAATGSALTTFADFSSGATIIHVFYLGTNANVYQLYWTTAWHSADPTSLAGAPAAGYLGSLTSFIGSGVVHVFYLSSGNVHELYWNGSWHTDDATTQAGAPSNVGGSALTSFVNTSGVGDTGMHVMYLGTTEHIDALHSMSSPAWGYFDATAASGGVPAVSGSHLASFQDTATGGVRLYFVGTNSHVYELYWPTEGTASETDLIAATGGTVAASGSALTGVMEPN